MEDTREKRKIFDSEFGCKNLRLSLSLPLSVWLLYGLVYTTRNIPNFPRCDRNKHILRILMQLVVFLHVFIRRFVDGGRISYVCMLFFCSLSAIAVVFRRLFRTFVFHSHSCLSFQLPCWVNHSHSFCRYNLSASLALLFSLLSFSIFKAILCVFNRVTGILQSICVDFPCSGKYSVSQPVE